MPLVHGEQKVVFPLVEAVHPLLPLRVGRRLELEHAVTHVDVDACEVRLGALRVAGDVLRHAQIDRTGRLLGWTVVVIG